MTVARADLIKSQVWRNYSVDTGAVVWPSWQPDPPPFRPLREWLASGKLDLRFLPIRALVTPCKARTGSYKCRPISLNLAAFRRTYWIPEYEELPWRDSGLSSGSCRSGQAVRSQGLYVCLQLIHWNFDQVHAVSVFWWWGVRHIARWIFVFSVSQSVGLSRVFKSVLLLFALLQFFKSAVPRWWFIFRSSLK
jgi:hypothetical protein